MVSRSQGWGRSESRSGWMPKQQQQNTLTDFMRQDIFYLSSLMWDVLQNCWRWHQWCHHLCLLFVTLRLSGWLHARPQISADSSTGFVRHTQVQENRDTSSVSISSEEILPGSPQQIFTPHASWPEFGHTPVPKLTTGSRNQLNIFAYLYCACGLG